MIGDHIRAELHRPLEGDRRFVRKEQGSFVLREHPEHIALVRMEKARRRVQEDVAAYRRMLTREANMRRFG